MDEDPLVGAMLSRLDNAADASGNTQYERYTYLGVGTIVKVERPAVSNGLTLSYGTSANHYSALDRFGLRPWNGNGMGT